MRKVYVQPGLEIEKFQVEDIITASAQEPTITTRTLDLTSSDAWVADDSIVEFKFD